MNDFKGHFSEETWLDFVRQLLQADQKVALQAHLDSRCPSCVRLHDLWSRLAAIARLETDFQPPDVVVRSIEAAFTLKQKIPLLSGLAKRSELVFDSRLQETPAGMRGVSGTAHHLFHKIDGFLVHLRLESDGANRLVNGQLLHEELAEAPSAGAGVVMLQGDDTLVAQTIANRLGEFQMEFTEQPDLHLYLDPLGGTPLRVDLPAA